MKLKTLEDLEIFKTYKKLLKEEAIKWVKHWQKEKEMTKKVVKFASMQVAFLDFFNITEEDLSSKDDSGEPK